MINAVHSPSASPRSRFDERKDDILRAAAALINQRGLRETTLASVAAEIGLNLKSIRYYFKKREDLVSLAFLQSIALHKRLIDEALPTNSFDARIRHFIHGYFDLQRRLRRGEQAQFVHFGDIRALTGEHLQVVGAAYVDMFRAARRLFRPEEGNWDGPRRSANAHLLISQLLWSVVWLDDHVVEDFDRVADRLSNILLGGLAARPAELAASEDNVPTPFGGSERLSQESFLRAATNLINEQGYRGASVDRISAVLKVTKGAFYHHNETRDQLVVACFERTFDIIREAQDRALAKAADGMAHVSAAAVSLVARQMRPEGVLLRTSALTTIGLDLRHEMERRLAASTRRFADMLNDGLIDGSVRLCDMRIASEAVTAMINAAEELQRWVPSATAENAADLYVRPLLEGLASQTT